MLRFTKIERPSTPREAYELLRSNKAARVMGGGLWMRLQRRTVPCVIDLSACGLDQIEESDDAFVIGAMTPLAALEAHSDFSRATDGVFTAAVRDIVGPQFRNLATVGGSLYGRFGFSDVLCALLVLECEVKFTGAGRMSLADLREAGYERDVLERVVVHRRPYRASYKCLRRQATDFPVVNVAAAYWGGEWHVAIGARPCRARLISAAQLGIESERPSCEELGRALEAVRALPFGSNYLASASYRRHVAGVLAVRAICEAAGIEVPALLEERFEDEAKSLGAEGADE